MEKMHDGFVIRLANLSDVPAIAEFHVAVWREAYKGLMNSDFLESLSVEARVAEWTHALTEWPEYRILVAYDERDQFLGFGSAREHGLTGANSLELHTLNLKPAARGSGLARQLIAELLGERDAFLWVVDGNERAVEFYRRVGFELTPERRPDAEALVDDIRMVRISHSSAVTH